MTRSSTKELFTPFKEPKRVLHSARKLFKTTSLDYSSSSKFDLFSYLEDQIEDGEVILFYKGLDVPTRQILDSKGVIPSMKAAYAKKAIRDIADHSQKWHNRTSTRTRSIDTSNGLATIQAQLNNLGREC
nr:hypothetical protein [Tanacetum cinerariifolium]